MKTVIVASHNPVKLQAVQQGLRRMFPEETFALHPATVPSGVSDQPHSDAETRQGAFNRAQAAARLHPQADFWIGVEGGVAELYSGLAAFAWIAVLSPQGYGQGRTGTFFLPPRVAELVQQGLELGEADDVVFGRENSKQAEGAVGLLTGKVLDRARFYEQAVILALIPFRNPGHYPMKDIP